MIIGSIFCNSTGNAYQSSLSTESQTLKKDMLILSPNSHGMKVNIQDQNSCRIETVSRMELLSSCAIKKTAFKSIDFQNMHCRRKVTLNYAHLKHQHCRTNATDRPSKQNRDYGLVHFRKLFNHPKGKNGVYKKYDKTEIAKLNCFASD